MHWKLNKLHYILKKWRLRHEKFNFTHENEYLLKGKLGKLKSSLKCWIPRKGQIKGDGGTVYIVLYRIVTNRPWRSIKYHVYCVYDSSYSNGLLPKNIFSSLISWHLEMWYIHFRNVHKLQFQEYQIVLLRDSITYVLLGHAQLASSHCLKLWNFNFRLRHIQ